MLWEVQATEAPQFEVYQLQHADVLISEVPKKPHLKAPAVDVQGSARSLASLTKHDSKEADPWLEKDPWQTNMKNPKQIKTSFPAPGFDTESIANQVEKRVTEQLQAAGVNFDTDANMENDTRVTQLEDRLAFLEETVQQHHGQQQQQQNTIIFNRIGQVQQQVEQQGTQLQQHFDRRMQEQLTQIEAILSKKGRTE